MSEQGHTAYACQERSFSVKGYIIAKKCLAIQKRLGGYTNVVSKGTTGPGSLSRGRANPLLWRSYSCVLWFGSRESAFPGPWWRGIGELSTDEQCRSCTW